MKRYKLTTQNLTTHNGHQWVVGEKQTITELGSEMCSSEVFHYYDHPLVAVFMNIRHADIKNPRLWEVEVDKMVNHDGRKGACKSMRLVKEIPLPAISLDDKVVITFCLADFSLFVSKYAAANAEYAAEYAAAYAAEYAANAANAATYATYAANAAANAAADAAEYAADAEQWTYEIFIPILESITGQKFKVKR